MSRNLLVAIGVVILIALAGSFFYLQNTSNPQTENPSPTPSPSPTSLETPTPSPSLSSSPSASQEPQEVLEEASVSVTQNGFNPQTLNIAAGTKVVWTNNSGGLADVESAPHPTHTSWPFLNLGTFGNGQSISVLFNEPGTYTYHNHLIPTQRGTIIVE